jgi:hypothetical protein
MIEDREISERWQEYFEDVLNVPSEETELADGCITQENRITKTDTPITENEVKKAIQNGEEQKNQI